MLKQARHLSTRYRVCEWGVGGCVGATGWCGLGSCHAGVCMGLCIVLWLCSCCGGLQWLPMMWRWWCVVLVLVCCWSFTSLQHLRSSQDRYWLVTVHTHCNVIVLPHWEIKPRIPWTIIPLHHIILTLIWSSSNNSYQRARKWQVSML